MSNKIIIFVLLIICLSKTVYGRNTTCNVHYDQYAPDHTFLTGYLDVGFNDNVTGLAFVFYSQKHAVTPEQIAAAPTLIWLNGGPGASSMEGVYFENGPYRVLNDTGKMRIEENLNAWTNKYNVLFIDNPIAVGFSRSLSDDYLPHNETEVARQFYLGLQSFYSSQGCYNQSIFLSSPLFITGESYCGKYIPNIAAYILSQNEIISSSTSSNHNNFVEIPLSGISIGDPLLDPQNQLYDLGNFGLQNNLISGQTGIVVNTILAKMKKHFNENKYEDAADDYDEAMDYFMSHSYNNLTNVYNYKIGLYPDDYVGQFCQDYIQQFGFDSDHVYGSTSHKIAQSLKHDIFVPNGVPALQYVLAKNLEVIIYNGDVDIMVNTPGITYAMNKLQWQGQSVFSKLNMTDFYSQDGSLYVGKQKSYLSLTFATVVDAGHLVPYDQPERMNVILDSFIQKVLSKQQKYTHEM